MTLLEAKQKIQTLQIPILHTHQVGKLLNLSNSRASLILHRLEEATEVISLKKGLWLVNKNANPFLIGTQLTHPYPAYISLQSALYLHGLISQIPETIYLITLSRSQRLSAANSTYSFHHIDLVLFQGFETTENYDLACPEKALFDLFYLSATQKFEFKSLPELEITKTFRKKKLLNWCSLVSNPRLRSHIEKKMSFLCN